MPTISYELGLFVCVAWACVRHLIEVKRWTGKSIIDILFRDSIFYFLL